MGLAEDTRAPLGQYTGATEVPAQLTLPSNRIALCRRCRAASLYGLMRLRHGARQSVHPDRNDFDQNEFEMQFD
jgi:hypothetical protein